METMEIYTFPWSFLIIFGLSIEARTLSVLASMVYLSEKEICEFQFNVLPLKLWASVPLNYAIKLYIE